MLHNDIKYFEDLDFFDQEVIIDLIASIIENKRKQQLKQEDQYEKGSDIFEVK